MIISFSASVTGVNTLLSKKFAWKINDLSTENLLDPVLNYTEYLGQEDQQCLLNEQVMTVLVLEHQVAHLVSISTTFFSVAQH